MKRNGFKLLDRLVDELADADADADADTDAAPGPPGPRPIAPPAPLDSVGASVGAFEAKRRFAELLESVAREGQSITITRREIPVARLVPVDGTLGRAPERLLGAFHAFQSAHPLGDVTTRELVDERRRG